MSHAVSPPDVAGTSETEPSVFVPAGRASVIAVTAATVVTVASVCADAMDAVTGKVEAALLRTYIEPSANAPAAAAPAAIAPEAIAPDAIEPEAAVMAA